MFWPKINLTIPPPANAIKSWPYNGKGAVGTEDAHLSIFLKLFLKVKTKD